MAFLEGLDEPGAEFEAEGVGAPDFQFIAGLGAGQRRKPEAQDHSFQTVSHACRLRFGMKPASS